MYNISYIKLCDKTGEFAVHISNAELYNVFEYYRRFVNDNDASVNSVMDFLSPESKKHLLISRYIGYGYSSEAKIETVYESPASRWNGNKIRSITFYEQALLIHTLGPVYKWNLENSLDLYNLLCRYFSFCHSKAGRDNTMFISLDDGKNDTRFGTFCSSTELYSILSGACIDWKDNNEQCLREHLLQFIYNSTYVKDDHAYSFLPGLANDMRMFAMHIENETISLFTYKIDNPACFQQIDLMSYSLRRSIIQYAWQHWKT